MARDFLVYGEDEQKTVLKNVFAKMDLDPKQYVPSAWVEKISSVKDKGAGHIADGMTKTIMDEYNAELARLNAVDFGDIILKVLQLFETAPDVLTRYQHQFKYIMVDEFQDTNNAQHQFLKYASGEYGNICCVGDDDQSIYSWRGAEIKHILNFDKNYPNAKIIRLETNYRSTSNILNAANSLIRNNSGRLGKDLRPSDDNNSGERVYVATLPTDLDEARMISRAIADNNGGNYSDFAVLIRAGALSRVFEEEFAASNIPYRLVGATKFYDRMEIRDAIAYIRLLVYPFDDLSFLRIIGKPRRGFGPGAIAKLANFGNHFMDSLRAAPLAAKQRAAADEFLHACDFDFADMQPMDAAAKILEDSGYMKMWQESKDIDAPDRLMNIRELLTNVIAKYDALGDFLEHAALMTADDNDNDADLGAAVSIMTIHAAKGLEFDTVFLPAWEDGVFPNDKAITDGGLEEERRLAYVAITRARRRAIISNAMSRLMYGQRSYNAPSRFIAEMDAKYLNISGAHMARAATYSVSDFQKRAPRRAQKNTSAVGKLVKHPELGRGVVIEDAGDILTIAFRDRGIKKVARNFLEMNNE
jgi:DNA helicase-2/ATP-dependent DNA helicase PcrA